MHNHDEYLAQIEKFLSDLTPSERLKILTVIQADIQDKPDQDLPEPLALSNIKRGEFGHTVYIEKKPFSFVRLFLKLSALMSIVFILFISVLIYKFTPVLKIDEKNNRVIILGGLIDIDGKAGKYKIMDDYHFASDKFTNDLQANIDLDQEKDEIIVSFDSGSFELRSSEDGDLKLDCKLANPATPETIVQQPDLIQINLKETGGSNCKISVPEDKKISLEGNDTAVTIMKPVFNVYVDIKNGKVAINPEQEIDYRYNLEVQNGYVGEFESSDEENAFEVQINIENGAIIRK